MCSFQVKMFVLAIFLTVCVIEVQNRVLMYSSSTGQQFPYKPGCYVDTIQHFLSFNESYSPQDDQTCEKYTCDFDGYIYITSCTETFEGDCVKVAGNKTLPYPSCCDYLNCNKRNKTLASQLASDPIPDNDTQNKSIEDLGNNPTSENNLTSVKETSKELSESSIEKSSFNKTFINENTSPSSDIYTVSPEMDNQDNEEKSEITETTLPENEIQRTTLSDITDESGASNNFPSQDQSTVSSEMNSQNDEKNPETTEIPEITPPELTDNLKAEENNVENSKNIAEDETITQSEKQAKGIEESSPETEETE